MSWRLSAKLLMILLVIFTVTGCSTSLCKKRGVLFRGDWAFEINRTPWVGCPANCPSDSESEGLSFWKSKDKSGDSPKKGLRNRVQCQHGNPLQNCAQCYMLNQGISPQQNAMNGISLSNLPPGSMVVPNGAILPNGVFVPNNVLSGSMAGQANGIQGGGSTGNGDQGAGSSNRSAAVYDANGQVTMVPSANGMMTIVTNDGTTTQLPLAANGLLINPAGNHVVPGLSMSGYAAPGYPPIAYSPNGYSPGYAQPYEMPPLAGNTDAGEMVAENQLSESQADMPYPRYNPVPTQPVFQRSMGMAPQYQAMQPPMVMPPGELNMYGYPSALNPYAASQPAQQQNVLQQQMLYQAKLKEQAQRKALAQKTAQQRANQSKIILASQQSLISNAAAKRQ